jgi:transposase
MTYAQEQSLSISQIEDIRLASSKLHGTDRRAFQAEMALKHCQGNARLTESVFGWGRNTVETGLGENRTGIICVGAQSGFGGNKRWEERYPDAAAALQELAQEHSQQDPTFKSSIAYTRLTASEALRQLALEGFPQDQIPSPSAMAEILNRMGYRLRKVVKAKPKKIPQTDDIFENIKAKDRKAEIGVKRLSIDCKATVNVGDYSRNGKTRGNIKANDHDMGCEGKYIPCGIVDEDTGALHIFFGSSYKTSDFIVDSLEDWWNELTPQNRENIQLIQLKIDNGPESSGVRTQFLKRMVDFSDQIGTPIQLLYYPPYHSKYNPIERCWGILEQHWNGSLLTDVETMLAWALSMTWKGLHPIVKLSKTMYDKGISLTKKAMQEIEMRLERNLLLPKWDILIQPK